MTEIEQFECGEASWRFYHAVITLEDIFRSVKRFLFYRRENFRTWPPVHRGVVWEDLR